MQENDHLLPILTANNNLNFILRGDFKINLLDNSETAIKFIDVNINYLLNTIIFKLIRPTSALY